MAQYVDSRRMYNAANTEFRYVYCKSFEWLSAIDSENTGGHPKPNTLYRAVYNTDTGSYALVVGENAIFIRKLEHKEPSVDAPFSSDIRLLSIDNIIDLNLTEDDLDSILEWTSTDNCDLRRAMGLTDDTVKDIVDMAHDVKIATDDEFDDFVATASELHELNTPLLYALHDVMKYAVDKIHNISDGPIDSDWLTLTKKHGAGINIHESIKCLVTYIGADSSKNNNRDDIREAINNLLTELIRRDYHNIDGE